MAYKLLDAAQVALQRRVNGHEQLLPEHARRRAVQGQVIKVSDDDTTTTDEKVSRLMLHLLIHNI